MLLGITAGITGHDASDSLFFGVIYLPMIVFLIASIIPSLALTVRRLHDQDKSGWFLLLMFIPAVGWIFWLIIAFWSGTDGENAFGYDPREGDVREPDDLARVFS